MRFKPLPRLGEETRGMAYNQRTADIVYRMAKHHGIKMMPQRILEAGFGAAWGGGQAKDKVGKLMLSTRLWNSALNQETFGRDSVYQRRK